ncbi:endonuclease/exonuclease/phosphatase family protein [Oceanihabitans sp. 2_MG-2023]|uniref:endonuclease/exonuclease/phosphatase family protein n=1 Tax=Oceanihabitans sp. 2_MG-2023 TaxID=3062661 RepID=UPI0026E329F1|nr:endonuclease/exonuclease/phosphatase family protein [Oceanihabitans sp. 2_MG-2023]MDO6598123.1 endonuclease/exonuclease/phosphatase family protein [Oceanihabitans sp. 2_MG-2023]
MKNLNFINKIVFFFNSVAATLLLLSYVLPFVPPKTFSILSVLSLGVPFLILVNVLFFLYWLLKIKKQFFLSLFVLVIGYMSFGSLYKFSNKVEVAKASSLTVMNYNVRLFNLYHWIEEDNTDLKLIDFIKEKAPDVVSFQEYHPKENIDLSFFKYKFEKLTGNKIKFGQAIFSQYPIINSGSVAFPNTSNNAIFVDIVKEKDTIRVYNVHLQSLKIDTKVETISQEDSERLVRRIGKSFEMQQTQTELFLKHKKQCKYKVIVSGDFNNTAFSYVYKEIKEGLKDAFKVAGNGFGRTYDFKFFPTRIDFILVDKNFKVDTFKTYDVHYSDHFPVMTKLSLVD